MAGAARTKLSPTDIMDVFQESWELAREIDWHTDQAKIGETEITIPEGIYNPDWVSTVPVDVARLGLSATEHRVRAERGQARIHDLSREAEKQYEGVRVTVTDQYGASIWPPLEVTDNEGEKSWSLVPRERRPEQVTGYLTRLFLPGIVKPPLYYPDPKLFEDIPIRYRQHEAEPPQNVIYIPCPARRTPEQEETLRSHCPKSRWESSSRR